MTMQCSVIVLSLLLFLVGSADSYWDGLRVTFGTNPVEFFCHQPRTLAEATAQGWLPVGDDTCTQSAHYNGRAYVMNGDYSITLLFDVAGFIAGIQAGIPVPPSKTSYPSQNIQPPFVLDGITNTRYIITAYFTDPQNICHRGRGQIEFDVLGTGDNLWLQTGMYPSNVTLIPKQQSNVGAPWVKGQCFKIMGQHYWYNTSTSMHCDDFYPVFLLYNNGELNAFGWAFGADLSSPNYEHPTAPFFPLFFKSIPNCLYQIPKMSTMHIFLTANPFTNNC